MRRLALTALLPCVLVAAVGCHSAPRIVPTPPLRPTSIAVTPGQVAPAGSWTTPSTPQPTLTRTPSGLPDSLITNPQNPTFGTPGVEEGGLEARFATAAPWQVIVSGLTTYQVASELETGGEGPSTWVHDVRLSFEKPLDFFGRFGVALTYTNHRYDWSGPNGLIAGTERPFENVDTLRAGVNIFQPVSESWALVASFTASVSAADGADFADGFSWSATAGGGYRFSQQFDAGLGVLISDSFGDGLFVIGGPQFSWRPSEHWQVALQGAALDIAWKPTPAWELGLSGSFQGARFRLPDDAPGARPGGIVAESRLPVFFWVRYRGGAAFDLELRAGLDVWRYFTVEDRNGHAEYSVEMDPAPFFGVRAIFRL